MKASDEEVRREDDLEKDLDKPNAERIDAVDEREGEKWHELNEKLDSLSRMMSETDKKAEAALERAQAAEAELGMLKSASPKNTEESLEKALESPLPENVDGQDEVLEATIPDILEPETLESEKEKPRMRRTI